MVAGAIRAEEDNGQNFGDNPRDGLNDSMDSYEELSNKNASMAAIKNVGYMAFAALLFALGITLIDIAGIHYGHFMKSSNGVQKQASSIEIF